MLIRCFIYSYELNGVLECLDIFENGSMNEWIKWHPFCTSIPKSKFMHFLICFHHLLNENEVNCYGEKLLAQHNISVYRTSRNRNGMKHTQKKWIDIFWAFESVGARISIHDSIESHLFFVATYTMPSCL